jgi:hypothetical protein
MFHLNDDQMILVMLLLIMNILIKDPKKTKEYKHVNRIEIIPN